MAGLSSKSREKVALAVFAGLIIAFICVVIIYIVVGHSWNVAAARLDDSLGSMDGYTAILYDGVEHPEEATTKDSKKSDTSGDESTASGSKSSSSSASDTTSKGDEASSPMSDESSSSKDKSSSSSSASSSSSSASSSSSSKSSSSSAQETTEPIYADEVQADYEEKGANTLVLDSSDLAYYERGVILTRGDERFGVIGVRKSSDMSDIKEQLSWFKKRKVNYIIALTDNLKRVNKLSGIDIVISTKDESSLTVGKNVKGMYCVKAPEEGNVGAVIISPSKVVSSKVITEL